MNPESELVLPNHPGPWRRSLAFVDCETTGLKASVCDIIDVAVIRDGMPWHSRIRITPWDEQRADNLGRPNERRTWRDVTGYNREEWATAPDGARVAPEIAGQIHGCTLVAHNADFDVGFLSAFLERHGIAWRSAWCGSMIDLYPLARSILGRLGLTKFSLDACCEFLGLEREGVHQALGGAMRVRQVYGALCKMAWDGFKGDADALVLR